MPVVPEKHELGRNVEGLVGAQFWSQGVQTARVLTGCTSMQPCAPQPLSLCTPPGLSRAQFLVASKAMRVPACPGFCGEQGGLVRGGGWLGLLTCGG